LIGVGSHRQTELRGQYHLVAASAQGLAHDLLALTLRVDVGGVDEVDPGVERGVDHPHRLLMIGVAHGPEHHRAEGELTD
jgi:hypothetical protein